MDNIAETLHT